MLGRPSGSACNFFFRFFERSSRRERERERERAIRLATGQKVRSRGARVVWNGIGHPGLRVAERSRPPHRQTTTTTKKKNSLFASRLLTFAATFAVCCRSASRAGMMGVLPPVGVAIVTSFPSRLLPFPSLLCRRSRAQPGPEFQVLRKVSQNFAPASAFGASICKEQSTGQETERGERERSRRGRPVGRVEQ